MAKERPSCFAVLLRKLFWLSQGVPDSSPVKMVHFSVPQRNME